MVGEIIVKRINVNKDTYVENIYVHDSKNVVYEDMNNRDLVGARLIMLIIILSWWIYGKYAYLSLRGLIRHKNCNFIFPFIAALFAFANNSNDIYHFIYHPQDCHPFWVIFTISATLNWAPISWLQAYRLIVIAKIYLSRKKYYLISFIAILFSGTYCTFYFLNLNLFKSGKNFTNGCSQDNPGTYTLSVMISDIVDSVFSIAMLCILVYRSINNLKEMHTRNERLNDLVGQGVIELFIIAVAKIIIYPIIIATTKKPGFDCFWDILSVIVIISAFKMVDFPYEQTDFEMRRRHNLRKRVFNFIDSGVGRPKLNDFTYNGMYKKYSKIDIYSYSPGKNNYSINYSLNSSMSTMTTPNINLTDPNSLKAVIKNDAQSTQNYSFNSVNKNNNSFIEKASTNLKSDTQ